MHQLFIDFKKAYDPDRMEVLYKIIIEFGITTKLVRIIKMCLNEAYSRMKVGKYLTHMFLIKNGLKKKACFIVITFPLCFWNISLGGFS